MAAAGAIEPEPAHAQGQVLVVVEQDQAAGVDPGALRLGAGLAREVHVGVGDQGLQAVRQGIEGAGGEPSRGRRSQIPVRHPALQQQAAEVVTGVLVVRARISEGYQGPHELMHPES